MAFDVILTFLLVVLNGFFVAAEFAIVKVRSSQIALERGNISKRAAENIIDNLEVRGAIRTSANPANRSSTS
jgi:CBS domain containing-hemolysin-like protein